ncbi:MAG: hypothetical protein AAGC64_02635 [Bacteroidota bacterium]
MITGLCSKDGSLLFLILANGYIMLLEPTSIPAARGEGGAYFQNGASSSIIHFMVLP